MPPKNKPTSTTTPKPKRQPKPKDPKASHLYTDDNPSTTLHGTGFKDALTARHTLNLISARSLTYQWQVVNTMYHRAKSHPSMRGKSSSTNSGMHDAMAIFRHWLDDTYPSAKETRKLEGKEFKPLLGRDVVRRYLARLDALDDGSGDCKAFANMYVDLPKGKRLANVLVDDRHPEREDWEVRRERALVELKGQRRGEGDDGLWSENGGLTSWHLRCVGWAWSPVGERRLPP